MRHHASLTAAALAAVAFLPFPLSLPQSSPRSVAPPLSAIAFMSGCWRGASSNGASIEERYTETTDNLVIGMTRYVRGTRVIDFEFSTIERTDSSFVLTPRPKGVRSDPFPLKELTGDRVVWENLAHDFPQRIIYRRDGDSTLVARIEGKTPRGDRHMEWTMRRC